jgi:hypothetical protein
MTQKLHKKQLKYESILKNDTDIEASSCPTMVSYSNILIHCNLM